MVTSRQLREATSSVECPRCGSALVVPAMSGGPSEYVLQLRGGDAPVGARAFDEWLCRSCGLRWPYERTVLEVVSDAGRDGDPAASIPDDLVDEIHLPKVHEATGVTSRRVAAELRQAREARGLTLADAARGTRIWERYLQALEANAPLEEFPAPAYARFFLRAYAEFLGLDVSNVVREFDQDHPVHEEPVLQPLPDPSRRRRLIAGVLVLASIVALVALVVLRLQEGRRDGLTMPVIAAGASDVRSNTPSELRPHPVAVFDGIRAVLRLQDRSWVESSADGEVLEPGTVFEAGERVVYKADRSMTLFFGSAGAVKLVVNGEEYATGDVGELMTLELRFRDGDVVSKRV